MYGMSLYWSHVLKYKQNYRIPVQTYTTHIQYDMGKTALQDWAFKEDGEGEATTLKLCS